MTLWQEIPWANVLTLKIVLPLWFHQLPFALREKGGLLGSFSDAFSNWRDIIARETPSCKGLSGDGWAAVKAQRLEVMASGEIRECRTPWIWCSYESAAFFEEFSLLVSGESGLERAAATVFPGIQQEQQGLSIAGSCCHMAWGQFACTWCHISSLTARPAAGSARSLPNQGIDGTLWKGWRYQRISKENGLL